MNELLQPNIEDILRKNRRDLKAEIRRSGSIAKLARDQSSVVINASFEAAFGEVGAEPLFLPYVVSFCSHDNDDSYARKNGLLSMWRGYASGEGVAIVFRTRALAQLLKLEIKSFGYSAMHFGDVVYDGDETAFASEFGSFIDVFKEKLVKFLTGDEQDLGQEYLGKFIDLASRYKHRAFAEEREVRIVAVPVSERMLEFVDPKTSSMVKTRQRQVRNGARFIDLFGFGSSNPLPIERIIIGPSRDQTLTKMKITKILKGRYSIPIELSETPFIGGAGSA